jgi:hypothetical protein
MIYIIVTTSIHNKTGNQDADERKRRYIDCISSLLQLLAEHDSSAIKTIVVENNGTRKTFLDDLGCDVVYTRNNFLDLQHKGVNELLDIKEVIERYNIQDDDTIVKLTGRYKVKDMHFLNEVRDNMHIYDAFVKFFNVCTFEYMDADCVLGLFALKSKYLRTLYYDCRSSPECEFAQHVRNNIGKERIMEMKHLNLECCFADDLRMLHL